MLGHPYRSSKSKARFSADISLLSFRFASFRLPSSFVEPITSSYGARPILLGLSFLSRLV